MKPLIHARRSVKKFGGIEADYIDIHNWFDSSKAHLADSRHRMALHNSFGIYLCEQVFGDIIQLPNGEFKKMPYITISTGKQVSVRDIAEQHVLDDMGAIPTLEECLRYAKLDGYASVSGSVQRVLNHNQVTFVD